MECETCNGTGVICITDENGCPEMVQCCDCVRWTLTDLAPEQSETAS